MDKYLKFKLDVSNPEEIIKKNKSKLINLLSFALAKESRKIKVEQGIYDELMKQVHDKLPQILEEQGIQGDFTLELIEE